MANQVRANPVRRGAKAGGQYALAFTAPFLAPQRRFLIFCPGRVGSELLVDLLSQHPNIACDSEILSDRRFLPNRYVAYRSVRTRRHGVSTYGYKLIVEQLRFLQPIFDHRTWLAKQVESGTTLITLERRNLLHQAISFSRAGVQDWHHTAESRPADAPVHLDPIDVVAHLYVINEGIEWYHEMISELPQLSLTYEDDLLTAADQERTTQRVFDRLGLTPATVEARLVRSATADPRQSISNYDEIADMIRGTRYSSYVD